MALTLQRSAQADAMDVADDLHSEVVGFWSRRHVSILLLTFKAIQRRQRTKELLPHLSVFLLPVADSSF